MSHYQKRSKNPVPKPVGRPSKQRKMLQQDAEDDDEVFNDMGEFSDASDEDLVEGDDKIPFK